MYQLEATEEEKALGILVALKMTMNHQNHAAKKMWSWDGSDEALLLEIGKYQCHYTKLVYDLILIL